MDISRNLARSALARSANWSAIRALNAQTRPCVASRRANLPTISRQLTSTSCSREAQQHQTPGISDQSHDAAYAELAGNRNNGARHISLDSQVDEDELPRQPLFSIYHTFDPDAPNANGPKIPIRERLRQYEKEELDSAHTVPLPIVGGPDAVPHNIGMNTSIDTGLIVDNDDSPSMEAPLAAFEDGALVDFGTDRSFLLPGDLVELRTANNKIELAIFIRQLQSQSQFYTISGKWLHRQSKGALFFVPHFVTPEDLDPLLAYLPHESVPEAVQDKLQKFENALPRSVGGPLVTKMYNFQKEADAVYRKNATSLDGAYETLAKQARSSLLSLPYIAHRLLYEDASAKFPPIHANSVPPAELYAAYRALMNIEAGVKNVSAGSVRAWSTFEFVPRNVMDTINVTVRIVRLWQKQDPFHRIDSTFGQFLTKARSLIDRSRKSRVPTIYGQIGPARAAGGSPVVDHDYFNAHDLIFIRFIQCWVGWKSFGAGSSLTALGSAILRAMDRYDAYVLDQSSGWLLLQELGIIKPWEIPTSYARKMKGARYKDSFVQDVNSSSVAKKRDDELRVILDTSPDTVRDLRVDWKGLRAYCIDDRSAHEIDDAVSITKTDVDGEYWVHVHVADPASMLSESPMFVSAAFSLMTNIYLPNRVDTMFPEELVQKKLSLAPHRPTLTFSAKVNMHGDMLDHKITPGIIREVVYLSPDTAAAVCGHTGGPPSKPILQVGDAPAELGSPSGMTRPMSTTQELDETDKSDLKLLMSLGAARRRHNLLLGGINFSQSNVEVDVRLGPELMRGSSTTVLDTTHFFEDPSISLSLKTPVQDGDISPLMLLAAEVAAKWCRDRNIPIIYRVSQKHPSKEDPSIFFKKNILPYYLKHQEPPISVLREYLQNIGPVLPSSAPGRHVPLGIDGFSRCTSPLRRYSDYITHLQIEAALLHEAKTGTSLIGSKDNSFLPLSKKSIDALLFKQAQADADTRTTRKTSQKEYALQALLRAWKFGEGTTKLSDTFKFTVVRVNEAGAGGTLDELGLSARLQLPHFVTEFQDITIGDAFEVKLTSVNPYSATVWVDALHKVEAAEIEQERMAMAYL